MTAGVRKARFSAALAQLRDEVRRGPDRDHAMLPGERDLAERLSVSRTTLRRMLALLVEEGLLTHRQGVGTFVRPREAAHPVAVPLAGFTAAVSRLGHRVSSRNAVQTPGWASPEEAMAMACSPEASVVRLTRLRCIDDEPVARERAVICAWALPGAAPVEGSLYAAMAANGFRPDRALQRVRVGTADPADAAALEVPAASAVVRLRRLDYLADGRCCAFTRTVVRADRFDLIVEARDAGLPLGLAAVADEATARFA